MPTIPELMREARRKRKLDPDRADYWDGYIEGLYRARHNYHFDSRRMTPFCRRPEPVTCALERETEEARAGYIDGWNLGLLAHRPSWYRRIMRPPPPPVPDDDGPAAA